MNERPFHLTVDARFATGGGIGTYLQQLVPRLARMRPGWTITTLGDSGIMSRLGWAQIPNIRLHECAVPYYGVTEQLILPARSPSATDVFWAPHYNFPLFTRAPVVVTIHDVCHLARPEATTSRVQQLYARFMHDRVGQQASATLCVSEFSKSELLRLVRRVKGPIVVTPEAAEGSWFEAPGLPEAPGVRGPYVIYVGNFKRHKNVALLLRAFGRVMDRIPHQLLLVGRTDGMSSDPDVTRTAHGLGNRVRIVGQIRSEEMRQLVAHADAFVTASLYEGFGLPALEAMAAGVPCLVSRAGSLPEVCGDAAFYCDPDSEQSVADALVRMLTDDAGRERLRSLGPARARTFSWDRCAATTADVLESARG